MPSWWDYLQFNRQYNNKRNLEEGLFQIASQTCNILVKVNNTNNINLTRNNRSDEYGCAGPPKASTSMQVCVPKFRKNSITSGCNPGLSTVLDSGSVGNASSSDEELEQWEQIFMMRDENGNSYNDKRKKRSIWCRPSCIPVSIVIVLIVLVVLVPLLDQPGPASATLAERSRLQCSDECRLSLVESIPEGHMYPPNSTHAPTKNAWLDLIDEAQNSIEIASFYWSLRFNELYPYNSSVEGEQVFQALLAAGTKRNIDLKIAQNWPTKLNPNIDTEYLVRKKAAQVRSLNFSKLLGGGVLHTKFWIVDRTHFYIGSANMDWRSLTQVKELGIVAYNCSCMATDLGKIFDVYWRLGAPDARVPDSWPAELGTDIDMEHPANISDGGGGSYGAYITSSPPPLSPAGRTNDDDAIVDIMRAAEEFIYISVMDYGPALEYAPKLKFWPKIDNAIRAAALEQRVRVRMLISWWKHSPPAEDHFLRSLAALTDAYPRLDIQVRRFIVPSTPEQDKIPFARVNHNKYMVTERTAYIGTSNWFGDYFVDTAGVAFVYQGGCATQGGCTTQGGCATQGGCGEGNGTRDTRAQLQAVFERDWSSPYAVPLRRL